MGEYKVTLITESDRSSVAEHLSNTYLLDEPTLSYLGDGADPGLLKTCVDSIDQGISLKAINENGEIVGVFLSEFIEKSYHQKDGLLEHKGRIELKFINGIIRFMKASVNIFRYYPDVETYVDGAVLSVDRKYRSHGIGSKLFTALIALCKERNVPILKVVCSSSFTAHICERLGLKKIFEIPYREMKLDDLPTLDIPEPHSIASVYCLDFRREVA